MLHHILRLGELPLLFILRPVGHHQRLLLGNELAVDLLCHKGHEGMEQLQRVLQHFSQSPESHARGLRIFLGIVHSLFYKLDIPVAELIPDKVVHLLEGNAQLEFIHVLRHFPDQLIALGKDPAVSGKQLKEIRLCDLLALHVHEDEPGSVPHLICKVPACLHSLIVEAHVVSGGISRHKSHSQGVGSVLVNDLQRVNTVS